jgi:hypothetical protein
MRYDRLTISFFIVSVPQPGVLTPIPKLVRCGDSVFPGVGVPAVAASGAICAATLAPLPKHLGLMWDVAQAQGAFWKKNPDWMDRYMDGTKVRVGPFPNLSDCFKPLCEYTAVIKRRYYVHHKCTVLPKLVTVCPSIAIYSTPILKTRD